MVTKHVKQKLAGFSVVAVLLLCSITSMVSANEAALTDDISRLSDSIVSNTKRAGALEKDLASTRDKLTKLAEDYEQSYARLAGIQEDIAVSQRLLEQTEEDVEHQQTLLNKRLDGIYRHGRISMLDVLLKVETARDFLVELEFMAYIEKRDAQVLQSLERLRAQQAEEKERLLHKELQERAFLQELEVHKTEMEFYFEKEQALLATVQQELRHLERERAQKKTQLESEKAARRLQALVERDGTVKLNTSIIFPVDGPHAFSDSWHSPRSGGRLHEGTDIFALRGTPTVAVRNGVIDKASFLDRGLGGIALWVLGDDGNHYYYAHLESIAPGIADGAAVRAGQVLGYVGDTGNARSTPPHLHFGIYPGGGLPVNPYPYLVVADTRSPKN